MGPPGPNAAEYNCPPVIGRAAQSVRLRAADAADAVLARRDPLIPPRRLTGYVGNSDFRATGEEFLVYFCELADLQATDRVLDVGCGIGRMARVLAGVLQPPGSYDGFDVVAEGITWCREHYRGQAVPFRFQRADLFNATYNPGGAASAADYRFPYDDRSFDLVLATSVFTHLLPDASEQYVAECARILAPGGRLFATWYLLRGDEQAETPPPPFVRDGATAPAAIADPAEPESAVAYPDSWVRKRLEGCGLQAPRIYPGTWTGCAGRSHQDITVARRP
jgi:SAM-dependent methyltransferase